MRIRSRGLVTFMLAVLSLVAICGSTSISNATEIHDDQLGYSLQLPEGFVEDTRLLQGAHPDVVRAFSRGTLGDTPNFFVILVKRLRGTIGREALKPSDYPAGFKGSLFRTTWQDFEVDGSEVPESSNGHSFITFNVQIPLKREAIQISVFGPAERKEEIRRLLSAALSGLSGESNWIPSAIVSPSIESSPHYGTALMIIAAVAFIAGLAGLWMISKHFPKGTVLAVSVMLYFVAVAIFTARTREALIAKGTCQLLGFAGAVFGVVDLIRKRKPKVTKEPGQNRL